MIKPTRLAIGIIALKSHITKRFTEYNQKLYSELNKVKDLELEEIIVLDKPIPEAREEVVQIAIKRKFDYLFFLDSDTFVPTGAITHILELAVIPTMLANSITNYPVICLPVYLKQMPLISNIYVDSMFAPLSKLPKNLFKIELTGLAACLINLDVFKKIQPPYFKGKWRVRIKDINLHLQCGEDISFFYKLKRAGIDVYCEPKFICEHYDFIKDISYPSLIGDKEVYNDI